MPHKCISVREHYDGQVLEIVLGPPPGNIVTMELCGELAGELRAMRDKPGVKLLMLSGEGKHFSFGASVEEHRADAVRDMLPRFHATVRSLLHCDVPTLAKVGGMCLGGGFELALACGMIICDARAKLGVPEIKLGVFPPAASVLLPCKIGESRSNELVLGGEALSAEVAERIGLVNGVAKDEQLDSVVSSFIEKQILPKSASSLRLAVRATREHTRRHYDAYIKDAERLYLDELMSTADAVEGIEAFLAKRDPTWKNR